MKVKSTFTTPLIDESHEGVGEAYLHCEARNKNRMALESTERQGDALLNRVLPNHHIKVSTYVE